MDKREKIVGNLYILRTWCAVNPKYGMALSVEDCDKAVIWIDDTIALLKAQEPRVMTLEELIGIYNIRENHSWVYNTPPYLYMDYGKDTGYWIAWSNIVSCLERCYPKYIPADYGKTWRCWTSRPTDEQREAEPWN